MNLAPQWQCLNVQEFFSQANWDGRSPQRSRGSGQASGNGFLSSFNPAIQYWGSYSVQEFFKAENWMGQPLDSELFVHDQDAFVPVVTALVQDFFQYLPWEGPPKIARPPVIPDSKPLGLNWVEPDEGLTLTDLSDLF